MISYMSVIVKNGLSSKITKILSRENDQNFTTFIKMSLISTKSYKFKI